MELLWVGVAFALGFAAKRLDQPPLLGFLAAGFVLEAIGFEAGPTLEELADLGVLLLLFTIGLKLDLRSMGRAYVLGVTTIHLVVTTVVAGGLALGLGALGLAALDLRGAALLGFALAFSSTIFAVKLLEERDDGAALYGRTAIAILVAQDLAAVVFLAVSTGQMPSPWALCLLLLIPARPLLQRALAACGRGELLILAGLTFTLAGAGLFSSVGLKADLGALLAGVLVGGHPKADELSSSLYGIKDIFLVGFFLSVGLQGMPTATNVLIAAGLLALLPLKGLLFFGLATRFRLRARTSLLLGALLSEYSEFGLIVGGLAVSQGWLGGEWLTTLAVALVLSFLVASPLNRRVFELYRRLRPRIVRFETEGRIPEEEPVDARGAEVLIFGMGRVGSGAYESLEEAGVGAIVGFDIDERVVVAHREASRTVHRASATDVDLWERLQVDPGRVRLVILAIATPLESVTALEQLRAGGFEGRVLAAARHPDEVEALRAKGVDAAFQLMAEAGRGLGKHALGFLERPATATSASESPP